MPRTKNSQTYKRVSKKKAPSKVGRWYQQYSRPLAFIVAFAIIGTVATFFVRAASTATGVIVGKPGTCLDNNDNRLANGNRITLWKCDGTKAQQWTVSNDGTIKTQGWCLDVPGASTKPQTYVQLWSCNGTKAQKWSIKSNGTIVSPHSGLCLDMKSGGTANGTRIWMWPCNGTAAQKWTTPKIVETPTPPKPTPTPPAPTPTPPTPAPGGSTVSGEAVPGAISGWRQIFADDFVGAVPKGAFNDCNHNVDTPQAYCGGLKNYGSYYTNWWAYPSGWEDTAKSGADGNTGAPFGGTYEPQDTVSVGNGVLSVKMYRPSTGGDNHVGTVVPRKCMAQKYGRYVERFRIVRADDGFKSAHLFYDGGYEIDFPENDYGTTIYAFMHPGGEAFSGGTKWGTGWHTSVIEWTAGSVKFYLDGRHIGTGTKKVPNIPMSWILQNESSIEGPYAKPGASAQIDTDWVSCYAPA